MRRRANGSCRQTPPCTRDLLAQRVIRELLPGWKSSRVTYYTTRCHRLGERRGERRPGFVALPSTRSTRPGAIGVFTREGLHLLRELIAVVVVTVAAGPVIAGSGEYCCWGQQLRNQASQAGPR
jgi:hypothetical protein